MTEYMDLTPTWQEILPVLLELHANATTYEAKKTAFAELNRMAKIADRLVAMQKESNKMESK
jgi:hypothetical protein